MGAEKKVCVVSEGPPLAHTHVHSHGGSADETSAEKNPEKKRKE